VPLILSPYGSNTHEHVSVQTKLGSKTVPMWNSHKQE